MWVTSEDNASAQTALVFIPILERGGREYSIDIIISKITMQFVFDRYIYFGNEQIVWFGLI